MVMKLKAKSQITIPAAIVAKMGLKDDDLFDVAIDNGKIVLTPIAVYRNEYIEMLEKEAHSFKHRSPKYKNTDALLSSLESEG